MQWQNEAQAREVVDRLERLASTFHPFSDQFGQVIGVMRALRGLHPSTGTREEGWRRVLAPLEERQEALAA